MDQFESDTRAEARRQERRRWIKKWYTIIDRIQDEADIEDVDALSSSQEASRPCGKLQMYDDVAVPVQS